MLASATYPLPCVPSKPNRVGALRARVGRWGEGRNVTLGFSFGGFSLREIGCEVSSLGSDIEGGEV